MEKSAIPRDHSSGNFDAVENSEKQRLICATQGHTSIKTADSAALLKRLLSLRDEGCLSDGAPVSTALPDTVVHGHGH
jgi:RNA 2'-phosphotransferase, Tpt1 / KptA family